MKKFSRFLNFLMEYKSYKTYVRARNVLVNLMLMKLKEV